MGSHHSAALPLPATVLCGECIESTCELWWEHPVQQSTGYRRGEAGYQVNDTYDFSSSYHLCSFSDGRSHLRRCSETSSFRLDSLTCHVCLLPCSVLHYLDWDHVCSLSKLILRRKPSSRSVHWGAFVASLISNKLRKSGLYVLFLTRWRTSWLRCAKRRRVTRDFQSMFYRNVGVFINTLGSKLTCAVMKRNDSLFWV